MLLCSEAAKLPFNGGEFEEGRDENEMGVMKLKGTSESQALVAYLSEECDKKWSSRSTCRHGNLRGKQKSVKQERKKNK